MGASIHQGNGCNRITLDDHGLGYSNLTWDDVTYGPEEILEGVVLHLKALPFQNKAVKRATLLVEKAIKTLTEED